MTRRNLDSHVVQTVGRRSTHGIRVRAEAREGLVNKPTENDIEPTENDIEDQIPVSGFIIKFPIFGGIIEVSIPRDHKSLKSFKVGKAFKDTDPSQNKMSVGRLKGKMPGSWHIQDNFDIRETPIDHFGVYVYLDTDDSEKINQVVSCTDELIDLLGYVGPLDVKIERGSFIRISKATKKHRLKSSDVKVALINLEKLLELYSLDDKQAQVDAKFADVFSRLIDALKDVPSACIRAGSTLILKYETDGHPVIQGRKLTPLEICALEMYPEIQREPSNTIAALAMAVEKIDDPSVKSI